MPLPDRIGELGEELAGRTSRRGLLARVGRGLLAATAGGLIARGSAPDDADAYHFCGHTYTTGSCPHPTGLPRVDARGFPLRARDGVPVDDLGRRVDAHGRPVGDDGRPLRDPDGRLLPPATRTRVCQAAGERFGMDTQIDGSWYRCCGGRVRRLMDCCAFTSRRINGDAALTGYCYSGRKVFCVHYFQTQVPC